MRRVILSVGLVCALLLVMAPAATAAGTADFDTAVDKLFARGYPQWVEEKLNSFETNQYLGFRWGGSVADDQAARFLAAQFRASGVRTHLEAVPIDEFSFKSASVTTGGKTLIASTFSGVPPTPKKGVKGEVVYVGTGSADEFDNAGDVKGKIVLCDLAMSSWWFHLPGAEAAHRGAKGIVMTFSPLDPVYYSIAPDALGSFDATYQYDWAPMVYLSQKDGDWLKDRLTKGKVVATMKNDVKVRMADRGGRGYNVVATIPGRIKNGQKIVVMAHHDCHFRAGMDDTAAAVNALVLARAMKRSGYVPPLDVVFVMTTGEEYGYTNCYYDWLTGAWWLATRAHTEWTGQVRTLLNLELMALKDAPLDLRTSHELVPWLQKAVADFPELVPYGTNVVTPVYCWNDQWPLTAEGIPSVELATANDYYDTLYHTNYETADLVDWDYLAKVCKFTFRLSDAISRGLLPYDLGDRADDLASTVSAADLKDAGVAATLADRLAADVAAYKAAADTYDAAAPTIPAAKWPGVNRKLLRIEKIVNDQFTALDCWDYTIYPHQQVLWNAQGLTAAIAALEATPVDKAGALAALDGVGQTWNGLNFSHAVYRDDLSRKKPGYRRVAWGGQGQLAHFLDVIPQYGMIDANDFAGAAAQLKTMLDGEVAMLSQRVEHMAQTLERLTPLVQSLP
jgi:hypothetical protein